MALHQSTDGHGSQGKFCQTTCPRGSYMSLSAGDQQQMKVWRSFRVCIILDQMRASGTKCEKAHTSERASRAHTHTQHTHTHDTHDTHTHTHFLLSLSDLIRVTGALPIGCASGPLLPRAANFPYSRADRKLWLSTELRRDKEIFPLAIHISLHHISTSNLPLHLLSSPAPSWMFSPYFHEPGLTFCGGLQMVSPLKWHWLLWWAGSFTLCGDICILWHNPTLCT